MRNTLFLYFLCFAQLVRGQYEGDTTLLEIICKESLRHQSKEMNISGNPLQENYNLTYARLDLSVDPAVRNIEAIVDIHFTATEDNVDKIYLDFSDKLTIQSVMSGHNVLRFERTGSFELQIILNHTLVKHELDSIRITYVGPPNESGFGSFRVDQHNGVPVMWTLSEPFGSQDWWPCKNDVGDKLDSLDMIIRTPTGYRAASNGLLVEEYLGNATNIFYWKHRYPITPYLVAFAVTNYVQYVDTVALKENPKLPMLNYVYPESEQAARVGTQEFIKALQYYDSLFVAYPFSREKYGHAEFGFRGGQEHQTMSFVTNYNWGLLTHELAHQWFGDFVTCGSFEDIWLNEGFATYLEGLSRERFQSAQEWYNWKLNKINNITSEVDGSVKVPDLNNIGRIFSGRFSYNKGSYVLHMLRWILGEDLFYKGIRNYLNDRAHKYAVTTDLIEQVEQVSGIELDEFFKDWYEGEGYPSYTIKWSQKDGLFFANVSQASSHASVDFFEMPVPILLKGEGKQIELRFDHVTNNQTFITAVDFKIEEVLFDPHLWLISANNSVEYDMSTGISENPATSLQVFPNPVRDILHFEFLKDQVGQLLLINNMGILVNRFEALAGLYKISVKNLQPGMYTVLLLSSSGMMTLNQKIIKL